ncbi:MAG: DUF58 domain-containing protein [Planctomycetota bacterium]
MADAHDAPSGKGRVNSFFTTDFCPWANRFVYWLKEPVGWFVIATAISVLVGLYVSSVGWVLAACLVSLIAIGMVWPWVAVRSVVCSLRPESGQVHEDDICDLKLTVRNRLLLPIWGLAVEGYLDRRHDEFDSDIPTVALAYVRGMTANGYRFSIRPQLRGKYPNGISTLTCSFPFGIWTARRELTDLKPVTVWPKYYPIDGECAMTGKQSTDRGDGNRSGRTGDFIGLRDYRQGDCMKSVNWTATARLGELVVTERGGPQCRAMRVLINARNEHSREVFAERVRVAASVLVNLHEAEIPLQVQIGKLSFLVRRGRDGFAQMMDALTEIPVDGDANAEKPEPVTGSASILIDSDRRGNPTACITDPSVNHRLRDEQQHRVFKLSTKETPSDSAAESSDVIAEQVRTFWTEVRDANLVA